MTGTDGDTAWPPMPSIEEFQHWTQTIGRVQQLLLEFALSLVYL